MPFWESKDVTVHNFALVFSSCDIAQDRSGNADVVVWTQNDLRTADTGGNRDLVPQLNSFLGVHREGFFGAQDRYTTAYIPRQRLHFLKRHHFNFSIS